MKLCNKCQEKKPYEDFHKNKSAKDGYQGWCKVCLKAKILEGQKKPESHKSKKIFKNRQFIWQYLKEHPCEHCGLNDPRVMDFDHIDQRTKTFEISYLITRGNLETLKAEIAKCRVLCANCHRIRSGYQLNYWWTQFEKDTVSQ